MFNKDFYPTPPEVIEYMLQTVSIRNKIVLEPSAGSGNIVDYVLKMGAKKVLTCEIEPKLQYLLSTKSTFLKDDFLKVTPAEVSFIDLVVMNPPFSADETHILHAFKIMPSGCQLIALCNFETINNANSKNRAELLTLIQKYGYYEEIGSVFAQSERKTNVNIGLINILKPASKQDIDDEFTNYFDLSPEYENVNDNGLIATDEIKQIVSRYVGAMRLYDKAIETGINMNGVIEPFISYLPYQNRDKLVFTATQNGKVKQKEEFKLELQKAAWKYIFATLKMDKYLTVKSEAEINKFVETQQKIPFKVANIYAMIDFLIATQRKRMEEAIIDVFEAFTYDKNNQYKTNSNYLLNRKFIVDGLVEANFSGGLRFRYSYGSSRYVSLYDFEKVLCFLTGTNYDKIQTLKSRSYESLKPNTLYTSTFFEFKVYQKGTGHFTFIDENVWAIFNREVGRIKGFAIPSEFRESYQPKNYTKADREKAATERATSKPQPKPSPAPSPARTPAVPKPSTAPGNVEVVHNVKKGGLEIKSKTPLPAETVAYLKAKGFMYAASIQTYWRAFDSKLFAEMKAFFANGLSGIRQRKKPNYLPTFRTAKQKLITLNKRIK